MTVQPSQESQKTTNNWWIRFTRLQNPLMKWLLQSRLHFLVSRYYMLITLTGRKSGNIYTIPVQYKQVNDEIFVITSQKYIWWKNLLGGAEVKLWLRGREVKARADISLNTNDIRNAFDTFIPLYET